MNPPFEDAQDVAHTLHAFNEVLGHSGEMVAIVGAGVDFRDTPKHDELRTANPQARQHRGIARRQLQGQWHERQHAPDLPAQIGSPLAG